MEMDQEPATNGNGSDTEGAQANIGAHEQYTNVQDVSQASSAPIQATAVVQTPHHFNQSAVSVIQPAQASVIQTTTSSAQELQQQIPQSIHFQTVNIEDDELDEEGKKRRDILSRRPSYRKIYDDLSDGSIKVEDENGQVMGRVTAISTSGIGEQPTSQTVTLPHGIQITTHGNAIPASLQTIPISGQAATVVQYGAGQQGQEGQQFIYAAAPGDVEGVNSGTTVYAIPSSQAYTVRTQLPQGVVINPVPTTNLQAQQQHGPEDATRKREMRLLKNREAAKECRRKKKEYVKCLENRVAVLENQNKTLIEELKALKDLYCHKAE